MYKVSGQLPTLNQHDSANRTNKFVGAKLKREATDLVAWQVKGGKKITQPCKLHFTWHYSGKHDLDNLAFAKKYCADGLVKAGILPNDNQTWVKGFSDSFVKVKKGNEGVTIDVEELQSM